MSKFINQHKFVIELIKQIVIKKFYSYKKCGIKLKTSLDDIIEAIIYVSKTGLTWEMLQYKNIKWKTIYNHFLKWSKHNIFELIWKQIVDIYMEKNKYKKNLKCQMIDCTYIKSINGKDNVGPNPTDRGRMANKLSILTDIIGVPIGYVLEAANINDKKLFEKTLNRRIVKRKARSILLADKGYSDKNRKKEAELYNYELIAPNKINFRKKLFRENIISKQRFIIEAANSWIKKFKRIILRYDSLSFNFNSFILISFICITNKKINRLIS